MSALAFRRGGPAKGWSVPMSISLEPEHLKRYKDVAWLFMKYGRSE